jgi:hypothetical protein
MIKDHITSAEIFLNRTSCQINRDTRTIALRHICEEALDIAKGCDDSLALRLPVAAATLNRALFERFIYAKWVADDELNASRFSEAAIEEAKRQLRKILDRGAGKVIRESTGENVTTYIRKENIFDNISRPPGFEEMASASGIEDIYVKLYGVMSMKAHGTRYNMPSDDNKALYTITHSMSALLSAVIAICEVWYSRKRQLTRQDLFQYLKI